MKLLETPSTTTSAMHGGDSTTITTISDDSTMFLDDIDSSCSTPYVSAPSSPGRGQPQLSGFYYSAPASPMHFVLSTSSKNFGPISAEAESPQPNYTFDFDFSARLAATDGSASAGSMSSADELFLNGQIRPMKLSTHLQRPQVLAPLIDLDEEIDDADGETNNGEAISGRGRDLKLRDKSLRRRTRSMSPLRSASFQWREEEYDEEITAKEKIKVQKQNEDGTGEELPEEESKNDEEATSSSHETTPCPSGSSSRSSSVGRSSKRWVFLKEFLYRSKSEGRNNGHKFWGSLSFSPVKDQKKTTSNQPRSAPSSSSTTTTPSSGAAAEIMEVAKKMKAAATGASSGKEVKKGKPQNGNASGVGKRRVPPSPHELHYTANRAQAEELRKKTFLPYRQGLLGCLGFSSKSYGAMNGFARALNPVSSR